MRFLLCLMLTAPADAAANDEPVVEVFVPPVFSVKMDHAFMRARATVNEIYSGIGIRVVWRSTRSAPPGCAKKPNRTIVVAFLWETPAERSQQAMAFSNPYLTEGPCVTLLMDRLKSAAKSKPLRTEFLLGHVLAHEMGHVLQGIARHSETGVMKDHWSEEEIENMPFRRLYFTEFDAKLILTGLATRGRE